MITMISGCFDILHMGHIDILNFAKNLNGEKCYLIVAIASDRKVREQKGGRRPFNNQEDRKKFLESLKMVDNVVIFDTDNDIKNEIIACDVDYLVVGDKNRNTEILGEKQTNHGVYYYPIKENESTNIIKIIKKLK